MIKLKRTRKPVTRQCSVTGIKAPATEFYKNQNHLKAVDNLRRNTGATKSQLIRMFNQLNQLTNG
jgi:ABC-type methionine transport system ATPase subunit